MTTVEYLDRTKEHLGITSDYALAKALNMRASTISGYRAGRSYMDDDVAVKIANILKVNPLAVIACANAERAKSPEMREMWIGLIKTVSEGFLSLLMPAKKGLVGL